VLHTYGMAIAVGFIVAIWLAAHEARRIGLEASRILDLAFWVLLSAMAGSRLLYMLVEWRAYYDRCVDPASQGLSQPDCMAVLRFWEGGLVFQGGLLAATAAGIFYLKKNKLDVWRYADVAVASVPMGQFFGRLGCLAAGCCHGAYVDSHHWLGLHWGDDTAAWRVIMGKMEAGPEKELFLAERYVTAYPTQLMESGAMLLLFLGLVWMRSRKRFNGQILATYMMSYAIIRSTIELFRGDDIRGVNELAEGFSISTGQIVSLLMFSGGLALWLWRSRATRRALEAPPQAPAQAA
jgi:phosphatidylglycerol:prolipoprotein diacylglycerol transferase